MKRGFLVYCLCIFWQSAYSQKGMTTVGIQVKPIFPVAFLGTGKIINDTSGVHMETVLSSGYSAGLVIRHNFSNLIAFETGINYVKRKYTLSFKEDGFSSNTSFRIIGYEIPAVLMIYSQLGEKLYINGSMGPAIDMFASSVQTFDTYYNNTVFRNHIVQPSVTANLGCEYRTKKNGTLYIGASFLRPFTFIYLSKVFYARNSRYLVVRNELSGSYLTIDFRYFFPVAHPKK